MSLSYSGIINYGKVTLPSVESWGSNNNVVRNPPKMIMTRNVDKVGDTSAITATIGDSGDRYCEAINYYARSVNPMVAVSYGEVGTATGQFGAKGEAFLPYRVARDGAFRPPIWRQEDLLPLSRLPRNWTSCKSQPCDIDYSKRVFNCGTAETTKEVKNNLLVSSCEARKTIAAYPQLTVPQPKCMLRDPLAPGTMTTNKCDVTKEVVTERPTWQLNRNTPLSVGYTNKCDATKEVVTERPTWQLNRNTPLAAGYTNLNGAIFDYDTTDVNYDRILPTRLNRGSYDCKPSVPTYGGNVGVKTLLKVR